MLIIYGLAGLLVGAVLGMFASWGMNKLDRRVRSPTQVTDATGLEVLGVLPKCSVAERESPGRASQSPSPYLAAVHKLRTNLLFADVDSPASVVALVAPSSGTSTTVAAAHLGIAFAGIGRKVALVDADLREARLTRYFGSENEIGLTSVIAGAVPLDDAIVALSELNVDVLPAGRSTLLASDVLASDGMAKVIAELRRGHDVVLWDTPGLLDTTDGSVVGLGCDGVVLIAVSGETRIDNLQETAETLRRLGVRLLGAVLTEAR
jgi:receptor protein-tyrosine kinase